MAETPREAGTVGLTPFENGGAVPVYVVQVPAEVAHAREFDDDPLPRRRRTGAGQVPVFEDRRGDVLGCDHPARAERRREDLARGAEVDDDVRRQRGQ